MAERNIYPFTFFIYTTSKNFVNTTHQILLYMILITFIKEIFIVLTDTAKFRAPQILSLIHEMAFDLDLDLSLEINFQKQ